MTAPLRLEAMDEIEKVIERNLKAGDWGETILPDRIFVPKEKAEEALNGDDED